nr:unnamed protein product [Spirometra erinaceieuropaei]
MYGVCDINKQLYCAASDPPARNTEHDLQKICNIPDQMACCNSKQLKILTSSLSKLAVLVYYTSENSVCYDRLVEILCKMTCSPTQADFISVTSIGTGKTVEAVQYNLSRKFAQDTFDICAKIKSRLLGKVVQLICDEPACGMENFFSNFGKGPKEGGRAPYRVDYNFIESNPNGKNTATTEFSANVITNEPADVLESPSIRWIREHIWWFSMIIVFLVLTLIFLLIQLVMWCQQRHKDDTPSIYKAPAAVNCYSKFGASIQYGVSWFFHRQGAIVARPFHRIQQLILQPASLELYNKTLGPVFHRSFLEEVLDLQDKVVNITVYVAQLNRYASLEEICYKPLAPDFSACAVFSPLEYLQSDAVKLASPKYFDHISYCAESFVSDRGPLGNCRGRSGLPMFPNVVFGGFTGNNHLKAEAAVITLMTKNFLDHDSELAAITYAWETAFIDLVLKWRQEHYNVNISAMTSMPAVRVFALYAGVAIVINFFLQIFAFVSLITLDVKRTEANRLDLLCCIKLKSPNPAPKDVATDASAITPWSSDQGKNLYVRLLLIPFQ